MRLTTGARSQVSDVRGMTAPATRSIPTAGRETRGGRSQLVSRLPLSEPSRVDGELHTDDAAEGSLRPDSNNIDEEAGPDPSAETAGQTGVDPPEVITPDELAALLRLNRKTVYELLARREIPGARRFGRRCYRICRTTVPQPGWQGKTASLALGGSDEREEAAGMARPGDGRDEGGLDGRHRVHARRRDYGQARAQGVAGPDATRGRGA